MFRNLYLFHLSPKQHSIDLLVKHDDNARLIRYDALWGFLDLQVMPTTSFHTKRVHTPKPIFDHLNLMCFTNWSLTFLKALTQIYIFFLETCSVAKRLIATNFQHSSVFKFLELFLFQVSTSGAIEFDGVTDRTVLLLKTCSCRDSRTFRF